jgi:hypothetical protein
MLNFLKTIFNSERYQTIAVVVCIAMVLFLQSCESTCKSLLDPAKRVTRTELTGEISLLDSRIEQATMDLKKQDELRELLFNAGVAAASGATLNPVMFLTSLGTIFGIGAGIDNVRKRVEITKLKNGKTLTT